jgi:hypothetical protein
MITYSKAYATGSFTDYNETSPGMAFLEFGAYVGDGLSYYIDQAFNESGDNGDAVQERAGQREDARLSPAGQAAVRRAAVLGDPGPRDGGRSSDRSFQTTRTPRPS